MNPHLLHPNTEFSSERLSIRTYRPGDAAVYLHMVRDNRDHLYEFLPENVQAVQDETGAEDILRWVNRGWEQRELFLFALWENASGEYVGEVYLANPDWHVPSIELGYFLVQTCTGQGFATEAARAATRYAFEQLHVIRLDLQCRADNLPSQRVAERCGFHVEGRQALRHRKKNGELVDRLWYGLLHTEWQANAG